MIDSKPAKGLEIDLICGNFLVEVVLSDGRPSKIFIPRERIKMHRVCAKFLLQIIGELVAELSKTQGGFKEAKKILSGPVCLVVLNDDKQIRSCADEIAKFLGSLEKEK